MAKFKDVLSTTAKVILALALISVVLGVGFGLLGTLVSNVSSSIPSESPTPKGDGYDEAADDVRTSMPQSQWERGIHRAIRRHCFITGMSKEDVAGALGEPTEKKEYVGGIGSNWTWQLAPGNCLKYDGDVCVQRESNERTIFFSPKGNVKLESDDCRTLDGSYIARAELFTSKALLGESSPRAVSHVNADSLAKMEAEAASWHTQAYCEKNGFYWRDGDCHTTAAQDPAQSALANQ